MDLLSAAFLGCFILGFAALFLALVLGGIEGFDIGGHHFDLFGGHAHGAHVAGGGSNVGQVDSGPHIAHAATVAADPAAPRGLPMLHPSAVLTFLTWFGGAGFILQSYYGAAAVLTLGLALLAGLVGAGLVWRFLLKVLQPHRTAAMHQADGERWS